MLLTGAGASAFAATERIRITLTPRSANTVPGASTQISDSAGRSVGCYLGFSSADPAGASRCNSEIPDVTASVAEGTVSLVDHREPSDRCFHVRAGDGGGGALQESLFSVSATFTHPDRSTSTVGPFDLGDFQSIYVGSSPVDPTATPGSATGPVACADPPPPNRAPVAVCDSYFVEPGGTLKVPARGILANDYDLDGDPLTAVVTETTFPRKRMKLNPLTGALTFKPYPSEGIARIAYLVRDPDGATSEVAFIFVGIGIRLVDPCHGRESRSGAGQYGWIAQGHRCLVKTTPNDTKLIYARVPFNTWAANDCQGAPRSTEGRAGPQHISTVGSDSILRD